MRAYVAWGTTMLLLVGTSGCAQIAGINEDYFVANDASVADNSVETSNDQTTPPPDSLQEGNTESGVEAGAETSPETGLETTPGDVVPEALLETGVDGDGGKTEAIGSIGQPCDKPNELACAGHAQKLVVYCDPNTNKWAALQSCSGKQLCDATPGPQQGSCQDPIAVCVGKQPGDKVCDGNKAVVCGPDLVTSTETVCPFTCSQGECQGSCKPAERQCSGNTPQFCDENGEWKSEAACTYACTGQGVCGGVCTPGAKQCADLTPQTCNNSGQWENGTTCTAVCLNGACSGTCAPNAKQCDGTTPQFCDSVGVWQNGAPCPFACTAGDCTGVCVPLAKQCSGQIPQTCNSSGEWEDGNPCPAVCSGGNCEAACSSGNKQCSGVIPQTCVGGVWQDAPACQFVCSAGDCVGDCVPAAKQCNNLIPQTCNAQGDWQNGTACAFVCTSGECSGECSPGAKRCVGAQIQECNTSGVWTDSQTCPFVCDSVTTTCAGECVPGAVQCNGQVPASCDATGHWQSGSSCPYVCTNGVCSGECSPGGLDCNGLIPRSCDTSGQWQNGPACPYLCSGGSCTGSCVPGDKQCSGLIPQTCDATGQWVSGEACPSVCAAGVCSGTCAPGSKQCNGLIPQTCSPAGQWVDGNACDFVCYGGLCTGVCTPGSKQCNGLVPQTCDASGQWQNGSACQYVCNNGGCTGVCTPGLKRCSYDNVQTCSPLGQWQVTSSCSGGLTCNEGECVVDIPVGAIVHWLKDHDGTPQTLPLGWMAASGGTVNDTRSPLNGVVLPNLNSTATASRYFLRGHSASGLVAGATTHTHTVATGTNAPPAGTNTYYLTATTTTSAVNLNLPPYYNTYALVRTEPGYYPDVDTPVGTVSAWVNHITGIPTFINTAWAFANGQTITLPTSPYMNIAIPNLNGASSALQRFLRCASNSGYPGGAESHSHAIAGLLAGQVDSGSYHTAESLTSSEASNIPPYLEVRWTLRQRDGDPLSVTPGIGTILPWLKSLSSVPALPSSWAECNGQVLNDATSPLNGQTLPNINGKERFLRGTTASSTGTVGGSPTHSHSMDTEFQVGTASGARHVMTTGTLVSEDNSPPLFTVVYIIRVK